MISVKGPQRTARFATQENYNKTKW